MDRKEEYEEEKRKE